MRTLTILLTSLLLSTTASADLIIPQTAAPRILVPAAGNAPGVNGTYFRSDIQLANLRNATQAIRMYWLPQGSSGSGIAPQTMTLDSLRGFSSEDFVANVLNQTGVGSIEFVGVTQDGQFDPAARLQVTSRIWTPTSDSGTVSQTFPSIVLTGAAARSKIIFGMRLRSQFRMNVGISNPTQTVRRFKVTAQISTTSGSQSDVFEVEVQPRSIEQRAITGLTMSGVAQLTIEDLTDGPTADWHAWGSTIDNISGDAWSHMAFPAQ